MKLTNLFLMAVVALTFTTTANAEKYKMNVCIIAETSFWDIVKKASDDSEHDIVRSFGESEQIAYFKLLKSDLVKNMDEVRKRCKNMDKDVSKAYDKTQTKLQDELTKLY